MTKQDAIKIFEEKKVRTVWDSDREEWHYLTDEPTTNRMQSQACLSYAEVRRRKAKPMETSWIAGGSAVCHID